MLLYYALKTIDSSNLAFANYPFWVLPGNQNKVEK